jgi:hypothetical protein
LTWINVGGTLRLSPIKIVGFGKYLKSMTYAEKITVIKPGNSKLLAVTLWADFATFLVWTEAATGGGRTAIHV